MRVVHDSLSRRKGTFNHACSSSALNASHMHTYKARLPIPQSYIQELVIIIMNMAQSQTPFLFCLLFSLIVNSVFVQCVHHHHHFTKFSSVLSLPLYPYSAIVKQHPQNYTALILSRLASDRARLNSINSKLQHALHNNFSRHPTADTVIQQDKLATAVFPGAGTFLVRIGVGRPEKQVYLIADTGSSLTWLQCVPCNQCFEHDGPIFDPSKSSSFAPLGCSSRQCASLPVDVKQCNSNQQCGFRIDYEDGSYSSGTVATETLTFNGEAVNDVAIGCGHAGGIRGFSNAAGIIGLGAGLESFPNQIKASSFSYCLVDMDSKTMFSNLVFNSTPPRHSIIVPMLRNPKADAGFFYVGLTGIILGETMLPIPASIFAIDENGSGGVILDSRTTLTLLPDPAYKALKSTLLDLTQGIPRAPQYIVLDPCYNITSDEVYARFPFLGFVFSNGQTVWLKPRNYIRPVDPDGTVCMHVLRSRISLSVIGNMQQEGMQITYDLANQQIGFSPDKC